MEGLYGRLLQMILVKMKAMNGSESLATPIGRSLTVSRPAPLAVLAIGIAALLALPVFVVLSSVFTPTEGTWSHLVSTVLPEYIANSLLLMAGVAFGVM